MVHILSHVIQIIVLSSGADALLGVGGTLQSGHLEVGVTGSQKQRLILIHTGIGKQQSGVVHGHAGTRGPEDVIVLLDEEINKGLADLGRGPF